MTAIPTLCTPRLRLRPPDLDAALSLRFCTAAEASRACDGPLTPGAAWTRLLADRGDRPFLVDAIAPAAPADAGAEPSCRAA